MKKLILAILIILPVLVKSQRLPVYDSLGNVTYYTKNTIYTEDTIKLPYSVAKTIAKELVGCDSTKAILQLTKEQLVLTEQKVVLKDSIIANHEHKGLMYENIIANQDQKFGLQSKWVTELEKKNKVLKVKLTFTRVISTVFVGILAFIYITK